MSSKKTKTKKIKNEKNPYSDGPKSKKLKPTQKPKYKIKFEQGDYHSLF